MESTYISLFQIHFKYSNGFEIILASQMKGFTHHNQEKPPPAGADGSGASGL
jgi:hypothetical protein